MARRLWHVSGSGCSLLDDCDTSSESTLFCGTSLNPPVCRTSPSIPPSLSAKNTAIGCQLTMVKPKNTTIRRSSTCCSILWSPPRGSLRDARIQRFIYFLIFNLAFGTNLLKEERRNIHTRRLCPLMCLCLTPRDFDSVTICDYLKLTKSDSSSRVITTRQTEKTAQQSS